MTVNERIKERRNELNLTQEELAKRMGYKSRTAISNVEKNSEDLTITRVIKFAEALECTPADLTGWVNESDTPNIDPTWLTTLACDGKLNKLVEIYKSLDSDSQTTLLRFAKFLSS